MSAPKKQRDYYSGKKKRHKHKSQVFIELGSNRILSTMYGPGRQHDFSLLKQSRCSHKLHKNIELLADSGYQGVAKIHANSRTPYKRWRGKTLSPQQLDHNRTLAKARICVEHVIHKLKVFRILKETYRHRRRRFALRLILIAVLYNFDLDSP